MEMTSDIATEERIFEAALIFENAAERDAYLRQACAGNQTLEDRIRLLLRHALSADKFFDLPSVVREGAHAVAGALPRPDQTGERIGPYKLIEKIGTGGEGIVYAAAQDEPVKRTVALKLMGFGLSTSETRNRFLAERQTLAMMEHPNIARIYDAGATADGIPWFAMELVRGIRITTFSNEARLSTRARLRMFIQVCHGVQHAHQKGVIHRDLKPANVLVTVDDGIPSPKIIDFGIAKAVHETVGETRLGTTGPAFAGTPRYMSPEQFAPGMDIDTRSDVYSLGLLLAELLSGHLPFDPFDAHGSAAQTDSLRPPGTATPMAHRFTRLTQSEQLELAAQRSANPRQLSAALAGDLQPIVSKCLAQDRENRYQAASDLAEDLRRFLKNEPISARPSTGFYRAAKFAARNKVAVASALVVILALTIGIFLSTSAFFSERRAKNQIEQSREREQNERRRAEAGELRARRFAYASDVNLAQQALDISNRGRAREILERNIPRPGEADLRGWEWWHLWEASRSDATATLADHEPSIFSVAFAANGRLVTRDGAFNLAIRDFRDGGAVVRNTVEGYGRALAVDPKGTLVILSAVPEKNRFLRRIEVGNESKWQDFPVESSPFCLGFSPDGALLAGICLDQKARIWNPARFEVLARFPASPVDGWHKGAVAFAPQGRLLAFGNCDGNVVIVETDRFQVVTNFIASKEGVTAMAFSPNGSILATGSGFSESTIKLWDPRTGLSAKPPLAGHLSWVSALAFSPAGDILASASGDQTIRIWKTDHWTSASVLRGHSDEVYSLAFSADGKQLVSGSKSGEVMVWDSGLVRRAEAFSQFPKKVSHFAFLSNPPGLLALRRSLIMDRTPPSEPFVADQVGTALSEGEMAVNADSTLAAIAGQDGAVCLWDLRSRRILRKFDLKPGRASLAQFSRRNPNRLMVVDVERTVRIWSCDTGEPVASWQIAPDPRPGITITAAAVSPDLATLATGWIDGALRIWDAETGRLLRSTNAHTRIVTSIDFSKDGKSIVTGSEDALVKIWRTSDWENTAVLRGHSLGVHSVAFSPDGARVVSGSVDRQAVKVWDMATLQELITLKATGTSFRQTRFSPDGKTLGSVNENGFLYLWSAGQK